MLFSSPDSFTVRIGLPAHNQNSLQSGDYVLRAVDGDFGTAFILHPLWGSDFILRVCPLEIVTVYSLQYSNRFLEGCRLLISTTTCCNFCVLFVFSWCHFFLGFLFYHFFHPHAANKGARTNLLTCLSLLAALGSSSAAMLDLCHWVICELLDLLAILGSSSHFSKSCKHCMSLHLCTYSLHLSSGLAAFYLQATPIHPPNNCRDEHFSDV